MAHNLSSWSGMKTAFKVRAILLLYFKTSTLSSSMQSWSQALDAKHWYSKEGAAVFFMVLVIKIKDFIFLKKGVCNSNNRSFFYLFSF